jgi:Flp pilus assembly protein TadG
MRTQGISVRPRGVAAVEFALLLPVLLAMIFGTTELGRAIYTYNTLDKAVRDAARHLSQHGPGDPLIIQQARCLAVYGNTGCSGSPLAPGLSTAAVQVCDALSCPATHAAQATGLGAVSLVTVTITGYAFGSAVAFVVPDMSFNDISATLRSAL